MEDIIDQAKQEVEEAKRIWDEAVKIKKLPKQKEGIYNKKKRNLKNSNQSTMTKEDFSS